MSDQQVLTQVEFDDGDFEKAEKIARALGFEQTAYTSTSSLWGLFCLRDNPGDEEGCIIKTVEIGFLFVQDGEDRNLGLDWSHVGA